MYQKQRREYSIKTIQVEKFFDTNSHWVWNGLYTFEVELFFRYTGASHRRSYNGVPDESITSSKKKVKLLIQSIIITEMS